MSRGTSTHPHFGVSPAPNPADRCAEPRGSNPPTGGVFIERRASRLLVYVISSTGKPLMPSHRFARVRFLLKTGKAKVVKTKPFTIRLLYQSSEYTQPLYGGTDPGRTNIGEAVLDQDGNVQYVAHVESRNKDIPKLMENRRIHRHISRQGERKRRQRRAVANGTITFPLWKQRLLPGCQKPITNKFITNSESRFLNRKRPANWLTPTANQLVQTHLNMVRKICSILPVTDWTLEINKFAFMLMEDGTVRGVDFQNGRLKGYPDVKSYICAIQDGKCPFCGKPIEHYHHIKLRSEGGSNRPENLVGLCSGCHTRIHKGDTEMVGLISKLGEWKKYAALSVLNQAIPYIYQGLVDIFGEKHTHICYGWQTKEMYTKLGISKTHSNDAVCIASLGNDMVPVACMAVPYEVKQYRRHDRAIVKVQRERTYKLFGETVAKNRRSRFKQESPSLKNFVESIPMAYRQQVVSTLTVIPSRRYYNTIGRCLPGTVFYYQGHRYVKSGQSSGGKDFRAYGMGSKNFPSAKVSTIPFGGLVYL